MRVTIEAPERAGSRRVVWEVARLEGGAPRCEQRPLGVPEVVVRSVKSMVGRRAHTRTGRGPCLRTAQGGLSCAESVQAGAEKQYLARHLFVDAFRAVLLARAAALVCGGPLPTPRAAPPGL